MNWLLSSSQPIPWLASCHIVSTPELYEPNMAAAQSGRFGSALGTRTPAAVAVAQSPTPPWRCPTPRSRPSRPRPTPSRTGNAGTARPGPPRSRRRTPRSSMCSPVPGRCSRRRRCPVRCRPNAPPAPARARTCARNGGSRPHGSSATPGRAAEPAAPDQRPPAPTTPAPRSPHLREAATRASRIGRWPPRCPNRPPATPSPASTPQSHTST